MSTRDDYTEHRMPSGTVCFYRDSDHRYFEAIKPKAKTRPEGEWCGQGKLLGVSTAAGAFDSRPEGLMQWAATTNMEGLAALVTAAQEELSADALAFLASAEQMWERLQQDGLTYEQRREERATEGTNVHKYALYALASYNPTPDYDELTQEEVAYATGVAAFWLAHDPEPLQAEQVIIEPLLGVAGRFDLRARFRARCGDAHCPCVGIRLNQDIVLADAKTRTTHRPDGSLRRSFTPTRDQVQLAGYELGAITSGFGASDHRLILQVDDEGGYELVRSHAEPADFKLAVEAYRRAQDINRAAGADRKEREAA